MAADTSSAERIVHIDLTADTNHSVNLTAGPKPVRRVELTHHGMQPDEATAVAAPVYFKAYKVEPVNDLAGDGTDGEEVLLAGERLVQNIPQPDDGSAAWLELICSDAPRVSIRLLAGGH